MAFAGVRPRGWEKSLGNRALFPTNTMLHHRFFFCGGVSPSFRTVDSSADDSTDDTNTGAWPNSLSTSSRGYGSNSSYIDTCSNQSGFSDVLAAKAVSPKYPTNTCDKAASPTGSESSLPSDKVLVTTTKPTLDPPPLLPRRAVPNNSSTMKKNSPSEHFPPQKSPSAVAMEEFAALESKMRAKKSNAITTKTLAVAEAAAAAAQLARPTKKSAEQVAMEEFAALERRIAVGIGSVEVGDESTEPGRRRRACSSPLEILARPRVSTGSCF